MDLTKCIPLVHLVNSVMTKLSEHAVISKIWKGLNTVGAVMFAATAVLVFVQRILPCVERGQLPPIWPVISVTVLFGITASCIRELRRFSTRSLPEKVE